MESVMLNQINFSVTAPSCLVFLERSLKAMRALAGASREMAHLALYCVELSLQDAAMLRFRPSERAAAAAALASKLLHGGVHWTRSLHYHCGRCEVRALAECERHMLRLLENEQDRHNSNRLTAIKRKFSSARYSEIAMLAASLDLEVEFECASHMHD